MGNNRDYVSVKLPRGVYDILRGISAETDVPISKLVVRAIREMLEQSKGDGEGC